MPLLLLAPQIRRPYPGRRWDRPDASPRLLWPETTYYYWHTQKEFINYFAVPNYIIGESEMEATKEGRSLSDFKYTCVGYSVFLDTKNDNAEKPENQAELPFCAGIEMLHHSQPRAHRSAHPSGDELLNRFRKNAGLVASGVAKNLNRVGNYIKESVDNILYPHRRRPK
ncbi:uncharacterized protein LOC135586115 isoform X1 [Musa acuminata AAA Group]|uniref:uncharacterized protein LOC135586115 isoform X1 n=1 Tax=Musa acuminata AAA Group TaxID=214697 RepID=UPI0031CF82BF